MYLKEQNLYLENLYYINIGLHKTFWGITKKFENEKLS